MDEAIRSAGSFLPTQSPTQAVFGEPLTVGDRMIIPVARVSMGFGGGYGQEAHEVEEGDQETETSNRGGGGGGGMMAHPLAVIEVTPERTRVIPIVDVTRLVITGMLLAGWNAFWGIRLAGKKAVIESQSQISPIRSLLKRG